MHDTVVPRVRSGKAILIVTRQAKAWDLPRHRGIICYSGQQARAAHLSPAVTKVAFERFVKPMSRVGPIDHAAATTAAADFLRCRGVLEASLASTAYLTKRLSVADFAVACILSSARMVGLTVDAFPRTKDWLARMLARESMRRAFTDARLATMALYEVDRSDPAQD